MTKIYGISSSESPDKIIYIGKTIRKLSARLIGHISQAKRNQKYGIKLTKIHSWILNQINQNNTILIELIDEVEDDEWEFYEKEYIKLFKSFGADLKNISAGGVGVISKGENLGFNVKRGKEASTYGLMRKPNFKINQKNPIVYTKRIAMIDLETQEILKYFNGCGEAANYLGCAASGIGNVCGGRKSAHTYYGYGWKYVERDKHIKQLDLEGNIVGEYSTYDEAIKFSEVSSKKYIYHSMNNNIPYKGHYWVDNRKEL